MEKGFIQSLLGQVKEKKSHVCVGLDPDLRRFPPAIREKIDGGNCSKKEISKAFLKFNKQVIDAVQEYAIAIKIQIAWFEEYGHWGLEALESTLEHARKKDLLTILDIKRGDIGNTAGAYARAYLGFVNVGGGKQESGFDAQAITLNPYLGKDSLLPFFEIMKERNRGAFILVKTSNPGSYHIQDQVLRSGKSVYEHTAQLVDEWSRDLIPKGSFYSNLGAVVGATYPDAARCLRQIMPRSYFLVPGFGAQGGRAEDLIPFFNEDGLGAVINASRSIIYAFAESAEEVPWPRAVEEAANSMRKDINLVLRQAGLGQ